MKTSDIRIAAVKDVKRIVIKIGSRVVASSRLGLNSRRLKKIVRDMVELKQRGYELILVSSGAIVAGMRELGLNDRPRGISLKQAAASIGQSKLIQLYEKIGRASCRERVEISVVAVSL